MPEKVAFKNESSMVVVLTECGLPESYPKGETIRIAEKPSGSEVIHAGSLENEGEIVSVGGRVLGAVGRERLAGQEKAYALAD